jgi:prophage regulatory protein
MGKKLNLMGAHEIRMRLSRISRQRVYQLTSRRDFPTPVAELAMGNVWLGRRRRGMDQSATARGLIHR